jgi:hypothetical protein
MTTFQSGVAAAATAVDDPLQHPHVVAEARPGELAVGVGADPVDVEDLRQLGARLV